MFSYFNLIVLSIVILQHLRYQAVNGRPTDAADNVVRLADTDGDGKVSPAENYHFVRQVMGITLSNETLDIDFQEGDLDHDGYVSVSEIDHAVKKIEPTAHLALTNNLARSQKKDGAAIVKLADKDGDGVVNMTEAYQYLSVNGLLFQLTKPAIDAEIKSLDKNHDGVLSASELEPDNSSLI